MKRWLGGGLFTAVILGGTAAFFLSRKTLSEMQTMALTTNLPVVRLMLGDDYEKIREQSTFQFHRRKLERLDLIGASVPVIFEYTRPGGEFTLPPARSFAAAVDDNHVVSVNVSPQLAYISPDAALTLIHHIGHLLEQSSWRMSKRYLTDAQALAQLEDASQDNDVTLRIEDWSRNDDEVYLEVSRQWRKEDSLPRAAGKNYDFCVVAVKIENDQVRAMYPGR
jgi:hypothetical protein